MALSKLAKRRSQASTNSLPAPRVRPRMDAMLMTGDAERRVVMSIHVGRPLGPGFTGVSATRDMSYRAT
jgi:hypothetical protein